MNRPGLRRNRILSCGMVTMLRLRLTQHDDGRTAPGGGHRRRGRLAPHSRFDLRLLADPRGRGGPPLVLRGIPPPPARACARRRPHRASGSPRSARSCSGRSSTADPVARERWLEVANRLSELRVEIVTSAEAAAALPWELLRDPLDPHSRRPLRPRRLRPGPPRGRRLAAAARRRCRTGAHPPRHLPSARRPRRRLPLRRQSPRQGAREANRRASTSRSCGRRRSSNSARRYARRSRKAGRSMSSIRRPRRLPRPRDAVRAWDEPPSPRPRPAAAPRDPRPSRRPLRAADLPPRPPRPLPARRPPGPPQLRRLREPRRREVNQRLIDGPELGHLLVETGVFALVLNACRSAYAKRSTTLRTTGKPPNTMPDEAPAKREAWAQRQTRNFHPGAGGHGRRPARRRRHALQPLGGDCRAVRRRPLRRAGARRALGEAVTLGRKQLDGAPLRAIAYDPVPSRTGRCRWSTKPRRCSSSPRPPDLHPRSRDSRSRPAPRPEPATVSTPTCLPPPDAGFFGRDETLLALDRAFDRDRVVLLHAWAGSGKTSTAPSSPAGTR